MVATHRKVSGVGQDFFPADIGLKSPSLIVPLSQ